MPSDSRSRIDTGETVGKWQVVQALTPGVPALYLARHLDNPDKLGTIKVVPKNPEAANQVKREVRILRSMDHPAIPKVYDFGFSQIDDAVWVATEYFDGATLADTLRQDPPDWQHTCRLFYQLAKGLHEAHAQGIVHQAVRPEKVLVSVEGRVQFADFETALEAGDLERTSSPLDFGPLAYAAPELANRGHSPRTDLYALGVMLHEALSHSTAFPAMATTDRKSALRFLEYKRTEVPPLDPGEALPSWLRNLVRKATDPDPERRLPDADAFVGWLEAAQSAWDVESPKAPRPPAEPAAPPPRIVMVRPSIDAPAVPVLIAGDSPDPVAVESPLMPVVYVTVATVGGVVGLAAGILTIVLINASRLF